MIEIILLELLSLVSFLYALILLFFTFPSMNQVAAIFMWTVFSSLIISLLISKSKWYNILVLLLLAPLLIFKGWNFIFLILTSSIIIFIYILSSMQVGKYLEYVSMFKKSIVLYISLFYIKVLSTQFSWFLGEGTIFLIIYLLSSIVLIRSIRHLDTNMDNTMIRNSNRKYLFGIILVFLVGTFDTLKEALYRLGVKIFELVEYILYILLYPLNKFLFWFFALFQDPDFVPEEVLIGDNAAVDGVITADQVETFAEYTKNNFLILKIISGVILFIVVIYILYKLLLKTGDKNYIGVEYTEHREYIKDEKKKKRKLFGERYPKDSKGQIRYYYRKYLEKLNKIDIEILKQDTSLDVSAKAREEFGTEVEEIREIYINSRYKTDEANKDHVEKIKSLYNNL